MGLIKSSKPIALTALMNPDVSTMSSEQDRILNENDKRLWRVLNLC